MCTPEEDAVGDGLADALLAERDQLRDELERLRGENEDLRLDDVRTSEQLDRERAALAQSATLLREEFGQGARPPATEDLEREPAVQAVELWLHRGAWKREHPSAETVQAVLAHAYRLEAERDSLRESLNATMRSPEELEAAGQELPKALVRLAVVEAERDQLRAENERLVEGVVGLQGKLAAMREVDAVRAVTELEMERDTLAGSNAVLREQLTEARGLVQALISDPLHAPYSGIHLDFDWLTEPAWAKQEREQGEQR